MATSGREPVGHAAANAEKARGDEGIVVSRRARPDEDRNGSRAPVVHPERQVRSAPLTADQTSVPTFFALGSRTDSRECKIIPGRATAFR
jgi:hypothetical protein